MLSIVPPSSDITTRLVLGMIHRVNLRRSWSRTTNGIHLSRIILSLVTLATGASLVFSAESSSGDYQTDPDIAYRRGDELSAYQREACRLDVYYPTGITKFPTVVWFHGGGLTSGQREIPVELKEKGFAVVAVDYRLHPKVKSPAYFEDAAAAVAWTIQNISHYGGAPDQVFVSGHSAGGYLAAMIGLDKRWLAAHNIDADTLAGLIPYSGQTVTHFTIRAERGIDRTQPIVDELAPLYHVRKRAPPMLLITGDRDLELLGRYEENAYLWRMMQVVGHADTELYELEGYRHGDMAAPAHPLLIRFVERIVAGAKTASMAN